MKRRKLLGYVRDAATGLLVPAFARAGLITLGGGGRAPAASGGGGGSIDTSTTLGAAVAALIAQIGGGGSRWYHVSDPANGSTVLGGQVGSSGSITLFGNNAVWNPTTKCINFVGADHGAFTSMHYVRMDAASHAWSLLSGSNGSGGGTDSGAGPGHNFSQHCIRPDNGDEFYHQYAGVAVDNVHLAKAAQGASTFATLLSSPFQVYDNITACAMYWSGAFSTSSAGVNGTFTAGAKGCVMMWCATPPSNNGTMVFYDPVANTWDYQLGVSVNSGDSYQQDGAYSPVYNCAVYGGTGADTQATWRLSATGVATQMPDLPGTGNELIGCQRGNFWCDPDSGKFLVLTNGDTGSLWELDPSGSGSWTKKTGVHAPPNALAVDPSDANHKDGTIVCPLNDANYGNATAVFQCRPPGTAPQLWLYKSG